MDKSTADTESLLTATVMDCQSYIRLPDPAGSNKSDECEVSGQANDLLNQFAASEAGSRVQRRRFIRCARYKYKILEPKVVKFSACFEPLRAPQHLTTNIRNRDVGVCNDDVYICNIASNLGNNGVSS